jgi:hypothetical protein
MKDIQARLEKCLAELADCETISKRATDKEKRGARDGTGSAPGANEVGSYLNNGHTKYANRLLWNATRAGHHRYGSAPLGSLAAFDGYRSFPALSDERTSTVPFVTLKNANATEKHGHPSGQS